MYPGGNCVNHAVFARRAGAETAYIGAVCDDDAGRLIKQSLSAEGVDISSIRTEPGQTAYCMIETDHGERIFVGANLGRPSSLPAPPIWPGWSISMRSTRSIEPRRRLLPQFSQRTKLSYDLATVHDPNRVASVAQHCFLLAFSGGGLFA